MSVKSCVPNISRCYRDRLRTGRPSEVEITLCSHCSGATRHVISWCVRCPWRSVEKSTTIWSISIRISAMVYRSSHRFSGNNEHGRQKAAGRAGGGGGGGGRGGGRAGGGGGGREPRAEEGGRRAERGGGEKREGGVG